MMAVSCVCTGTSMPSESFVAWKDDVANVRALYRERKYRRCAVLCSELLPEATHPIRRTFLFFYQAVCYETLGHISHNYSSNKIPLFEQARDAFMSASETLPLPFLASPDGRYDAPGPSPVCATFDMLELYNVNSPSLYPSPSQTNQAICRPRTISPTSSVTISQADHVSAARTIPSFDDYSPRRTITSGPVSRKLFNEASAGDHMFSLLTPRQRAGTNHKIRLSHSLSSQHALAEYLVPSPLFSRRPSNKKGSHSEIVADAGATLPLVTLSKPLPPTPINRPLPALPFNHQPHFVLKGKRSVVIPRRKTALATLISRFEGRSPFDSPSPAESTGNELVLVASTPVTERFKRISATFVEKEDSDSPSTPQPRAVRELKNFEQKPRTRESLECLVDDEQKRLPSTPCSMPQKQESQPARSSSHCLSSTVSTIVPRSPGSHLEAYNDHLSALRSALKAHITKVTSNITQTSIIQMAHEHEKRQRFANMHSRHSSAAAAAAVEHTSPTAAKQKPGRIGRGSESGLVLAKDTRLRSFWSLQIADAQAKTPGVDQDKAMQRKERIERLRADAWKSVRKEAKGWKGAEYYEDLRRRAEKELSLGCC